MAVELDQPGPAAVAAPAAGGHATGRKAIELEVKSFADAGSGSAVVMFAAFNNVDRAAEIIEPGAFKSLDSFMRDGFIAFGHDWGALPIGVPTSAVQDDRGLTVGFDFHSTPEAQAVRVVMKERMAAGKSVKGSIGYEVDEDARETRDGVPVRLLKAITLHECSVVNVPCNPLADAVAVKGMLMPETKAGRVMGRATHATLTKHLDAMTAHVETMGASAAGMDVACKALGDFLAGYAPAPAGADPDADDPDDADDGAGDGGFPIPRPTGAAGKAADQPAGAGSDPGSASEANPAPSNHVHPTVTATVKADGPVPVARPGLVGRSEETVAAFEEIVAAFKRQHATRQSEGRSLPAAKWDALAGLIGAATALYAERPAPAPPGGKSDQAIPAPTPDAGAAATATDWALVYSQFNQSLDTIDGVRAAT